MGSEIDRLLQELQNMKHEASKHNAKDVWDGISRKKDWSELGFQSEEELKQFLSDNPYANI